MPKHMCAYVCIGGASSAPLPSLVLSIGTEWGNEAMFEHQDHLISELEPSSATARRKHCRFGIGGVHDCLFLEDGSMMQESMHTCVWDAASMLGEVSSHLAMGIMTLSVMSLL